MYGESLIVSLKDAKDEYLQLKDWFNYSNFENPFRKGSRFLDLGCGEGHLMKYLELKGLKTWGIDLNEVSQYKDLNIKSGDIHDLPFENDFFDIAWSFGIYCVRYSNNSEKIINEALRVLKKGGHYLIRGADEISDLNKISGSNIVFNKSGLSVLKKM